jgi:hypothetical protein
VSACYNTAIPPTREAMDEMTRAFQREPARDICTAYWLDAFRHGWREASVADVDRWSLEASEAMFDGWEPEGGWEVVDPERWR